MSDYKHVPLLEMPALDDKNYIRKEDGGYAVTCKGSPLHKYLTVLSNCVGLACCTYNKRWQQIMKMNPQIHTLLLNCNAENFPERAKKYGLELSDKPSLGAIICWRKGNIGDGSDGAGHVATVEKIIDDNNITLAESSYGGTAFYVKTRNNNNGNWGMNPPYYFRYFIPLPKVNVIDPVERCEENDQIFVPKFEGSYLRIRTEPTTKNKDNIVGKCGEGVYYNVESIVENDGYAWYQCEGYWIASVNGVVFYKGKKWEEPVCHSERDPKKHQIKVKVDCLRIRKEPTVASKQMAWCKVGYYDVLDLKIQKDYTWFKIGEDAWIGGITDCEFFKAE